MLVQVATEVELIQDPAQRREILACTAVMAGLLHKPNLIRQLFREDIMQESLFYQEILEKGEQRGEQRGLERGLQRGLEREISVILRQIRRRVGELTPSMEERIRALSITQLEDLAEALLDFSSPTDLTAWLDNLN